MAAGERINLLAQETSRISVASILAVNFRQPYPLTYLDPSRIFDKCAIFSSIQPTVRATKK
jgi:hypothetical protein